MEEITRYLLKYYSYLLDENELKAWNIIIKNAKDKVYKKTNSEEKHMNELISYDEVKVIDLLKNGEEIFFNNLKNKLLEENRNEIFLNFCPICGILARTPFTRQCRNGHRW